MFATLNFLPHTRFTPMQNISTEPMSNAPSIWSIPSIAPAMAIKITLTPQALLSASCCSGRKSFPAKWPIIPPATIPALFIIVPSPISIFFSTLTAAGAAFYTAQKENLQLTRIAGFCGGRYKTRTCDLPHVKRMRYQLRQSSGSSSKGYSTLSGEECQAFFSRLRKKRKNIRPEACGPDISVKCRISQHNRR